MKLNPKLLDLLERAGATFVQGVAAGLTVGGVSVAQGQVNWWSVLAGAGVAAGLSVVKSLGFSAVQLSQAATIATAIAETTPAAPVVADIVHALNPTPPAPAPPAAP